MTAKVVQQDQTPRTPTASEDLSRIIEATLDKGPHEHVKCVRVFGDSYRCNWWTQDKPDHWLSGTTGRIARSRFLRATKSGDQLVIEKVNP